MPTPHLILFALVLPAVIAGISALLGGFIFREIRWGAIGGVCAGLIIANWEIASPAPLRIVQFGMALGLVGIFCSWRKVPWLVRVMLAMIAPLAMVWYVFQPIPTASMPVAKMWHWAMIAMVIAGVDYSLTEGIANRRPGVAVPLVLGPVAAGTGAVLLLIGTYSFGLLGAALGLMILGWCGAALIHKSISFSRGPVVLVIALLVGFLTYDYFQSDDFTSTELVLIAVAPLMAWVVEWRPMSRWKSWKREVLRMVLVFIPIGVAVGMAFIQFKKDTAQGE
jgi:hypothetical protein